MHISLFYEKFLLLIPSQYNQGSRIWESQDVKYGYNKTTSLTFTVILPVLCFVCLISAWHGYANVLEIKVESGIPSNKIWVYTIFESKKFHYLSNQDTTNVERKI